MGIQRNDGYFVLFWFCKVLLAVGHECIKTRKMQVVQMNYHEGNSEYRTNLCTHGPRFYKIPTLRLNGLFPRKKYLVKENTQIRYCLSYTPLL